jgi:hypothetical protein
VALGVVVGVLDALARASLLFVSAGVATALLFAATLLVPAPIAAPAADSDAFALSTWCEVPLFCAQRGPVVKARRANSGSAERNCIEMLRSIGLKAYGDIVDDALPVRVPKACEPP